MEPSGAYNFPAGFATAQSLDAQRAAAVAWMKAWLAWRVPMCDRPCIVFDIDDTLVKDDAPIPEILHLYTFCKALLRCFIVTARPLTANNKQLTVASLQSFGVDGFSGMYMMPRQAQYTSKAVASFKRKCRAKISRTCTIVANVGDAWTDFLSHPVAGELRNFVRDATNDRVVLFFHEGVACVKLTRR